MKLLKGDKVMVTAGRDRGKTGEVVAVLPKTNQVVVAGVNMIKKHAKPDTKNPKGGILNYEKPLTVSNVAPIDPASGKPARIGYKISESGTKSRVYRVSKFVNKKSAPKQTPASAKGKKS